MQFLGGNDIDSPDRPAGMLTYSFDKRLVEVLKNSEIWGKIAIPILMAFTSKYAVSLYENIAQRSGLKKTMEAFTLDEFRSMLGVQDDAYPQFGALNKHVIKPAIAEINALAPFNVHVLPVKSGKRVVQMRVGWMSKSKDELDAAWKEVQRSKVGDVRVSLARWNMCGSPFRALAAASGMIPTSRRGAKPTRDGPPRKFHFMGSPPVAWLCG
ncbi:MAG: replication initiation protein [Nitrospiraceae bacterium]|nr:replication initiation protein [Nitrospiraceae bacterium]